MPHRRDLLLVVGGGGASSPSDDLVQRVTDATGLVVERTSLAGFLRSHRSGDGVVAVWLFTPHLGRPDAAVYEAVGRLEEWHVPGVLTCGGLPGGAGSAVAGGVVTGPVEAGQATLAALLRAAANQGIVTRALTAEAKLLRSQQVGVADQFDKLDEELRMAVKIQREFLPKALPTPAEAAFHAMWRPAGYVGGDIYDVSQLDEHHYGLFLADAVGHGVPAALMTIYIKQSMRTREVTPGRGPGYRLLGPGEALATLNRAMIELDAGAASLGTAVYGVLDVRTQRLTLAKAGHPAPLLLHADGRTAWLESDGAMLGILPDEAFEEVAFELSRGDRLLIYSDGFEVAFPQSDGGRLANTQYTDEFAALRDGDGAAAVRLLDDKVDASAGSLNQRDDLTLICMTALADAAGAGEAADVDGARRAA